MGAGRVHRRRSFLAVGGTPRAPAGCTAIPARAGLPVDAPGDWRSFGAFSAFIVALFTEMYGFPLTIYLLLPWLSETFPGIDFLSHDTGHLLELMLGSRVNPHFGLFHVLSYLFVGGGFWLLSAAWSVLYRSQRSGMLATTGTYARIRHPQYVGFVLIMFGFLLQWPTILTLAMFPVLCFMYVRLAISEEKEAQRAFGQQWASYAARTPRFIPGFPEMRQPDVRL
jgi:methanethiol S-methyltransferase